MSYPSWGSSEINSTNRPDRVLLLNAPAYDTRLPWAKWQQPLLLLRLSTLLRSLGTDVKLVDALALSPNTTRVSRKRIDLLDVDGTQVPKWRFGLSHKDIANRFDELVKADWIPEVVYLECGTTYWWEGAREVTFLTKEKFPKARIVLIGTYPQYAREHAIQYAGADGVASDQWPELSLLPADLLAYQQVPIYHQILLGRGERTVDEIVDEIVNAFSMNVRHFAFAEHDAAGRFFSVYSSVLERLASRKSRNFNIKLYALGSIYPEDLTRHKDMARLMKQAGYTQICFADDRDFTTGSVEQDALIESYKEAAEICKIAGFKLRTDELIASACIGRKGEDLAERAKFITRAAHHAGSLIVWPYQPMPSDCPDLPLESQNSKIFPLRGQNQRTYRDYLNLLGLATVLSSKYRSCTFDFLGDNLIAQLFQASVSRRGWNPSPEVKGVVKLPMVKR